MMLSAYQRDRAQRNLTGYAIFAAPQPLGVRTLGPVPHGTGLGAITAAQAVQQAIAAEGGRDINPKDASGWLSPTNPAWAAVLQSGQIDAAAFSPNCAGMPAPNVNLFQTVSGLTLGTTSAGVGIMGATGLLSATAIPVVGAIIAGVGVLVNLIGMIFAHHGAMVRQEQQLGCSAIAAWNNSISLIDQGVQNGQITPAAASGAMDSLYSKLSSYLAPSVSHSPYCSADCELLIEANAIAIYRKSVYADMANTPAAAQPVTSSASAALPGSGSAGSGPVSVAAVSSGSTLTIPAASLASSPNWLMLAVLVVGGFALARAV